MIYFENDNQIISSSFDILPDFNSFNKQKYIN